MTTRFPSTHDIVATLGGTITRCGNRVLWTPANRSQTWTVEPGIMGGFRIRPFWTPEENQEKRLDKPDTAEKD